MCWQSDNRSLTVLRLSEIASISARIMLESTNHAALDALRRSSPERMKQPHPPGGGSRVTDPSVASSTSPSDISSSSKPPNAALTWGQSR